MVEHQFCSIDHGRPLSDRDDAFCHDLTYAHFRHLQAASGIRFYECLHAVPRDVREPEHRQLNPIRKKNGVNEQERLVASAARQRIVGRLRFTTLLDQLMPSKDVQVLRQGRPAQTDAV
jgi:hypothetical protein